MVFTAFCCMCLLSILLASDATQDAKVRLHIQDQRVESSDSAAPGNVQGRGQAIEVVVPRKRQPKEQQQELQQEQQNEQQKQSFKHICNHYLSGVDDKTLLAALTHKASGFAKPNARGSLLHELQQQNIFVAAILHNSEGILPYWTEELVRLSMALRATNKPINVFVSVYESGSSDSTAELLHHLEEHLRFIGVPSNIVTGGETREGRQRIEFLAEMRNKAMEPLQTSNKSYDRVLWLSDDIFCADGVLQMLAHALPDAKGGLGADAVCGIDYLYSGTKTCEFYDTWAAHDIAGNNFENARPYVNLVDEYGRHLPGPGENKLEAGEPFQVFSCWNAMVAFNADIFQKEQLLFRSHRESLGECAVAETELIFRDMWTIGRGKILVSPKAASAYNFADFEHCAADKQPIKFNQASPMTWKPAPETAKCCPIHPYQDWVNPAECFRERWNRFGDKVPTLKSSAGLVTQRISASFLQVDKSAFSSSRKSMMFSETHAAVLSASSYLYELSYSMHPKQGREGQWHLWGAGALICFVGFAFARLRSFNGVADSSNMCTVLLFWMCMSLLMNLLNKQCTLLLKCPFTLVLIQMLVAILPLASTPLSGIRKKDLWRWCVLALLFGIMLCTCMFAFTHSSVTYILILRNCLPLLTLPVEKAVLPNGPPISVSMIMSLLSIAFGAMLYARYAPGFSSTSTGLVWILLNCIASVAHRVLERCLLTSDIRLSFEAMNLINNVVPLLPVGLLAWATGETQKWPNYAHLLHSPMALSVLGCSGIAGLCLGQSSIMLQKCVSATTMMVLQAMNKMFIILAAMVIFNDRFTIPSFTGCALSLLGSAAYGMAQLAAKETSAENSVKEKSGQN